MIWHWIIHFTGVDYGAPYGHVIIYNFWSGLGSDLSEVTLFGIGYAAYRKHVCHERGCWRISRHTVDGSPWCDRHHEKARDLRLMAQEEYPELREQAKEGDHA